MNIIRSIAATLAAGLLIGTSACTKESKSDPTASVDESVKPYPLDVCLVSGEKLGSMGEPFRIVHAGQEIKFCCDMCEPKFNKSPEKYLAKLDGSAGE